MEHRKPTVSEASLRSQKPWGSMPWGPWHRSTHLPRPTSVHQGPWKGRHCNRMPPHPLSFLKAILQISSNRKLITLIDLTFEKEILDSLSRSWETEHQQQKCVWCVCVYVCSVCLCVWLKRGVSSCSSHQYKWEDKRQIKILSCELGP